MGQMSAREAHEFAEQIVLPRLLKLVGLEGRLEPIEGQGDKVADALDIVGGVDFWVRTPDRRLLPIASRVQWWHEDGNNRRSFTIRLGKNREAEKRVLAHVEGGLLPDWTTQGYMERPARMVCGGIIKTRELIGAFMAARAHPKFTTRVNKYDGIHFWPAYWDTLRRYGNGDTLRTIEEQPTPPPVDVVVPPAQARVDEFCTRCHSHFCPHASPHLYQPPFTKTDDLDEALAAWESRWPA